MSRRLRTLFNSFSAIQKRVLSALIAACLCFSTVTLMLVNIAGSTLAAPALTSTNMASRINQMKSWWPEGSVRMDLKWPAGAGYRPPGGAVGWQCFGFVNNVYYELFEALMADGEIHTNADYLCIGDHVRYNSGSVDHSIIITNIIGDTVYYSDCNNDSSDLYNSCVVHWDRAVSKDTLQGWINQDTWWTDGTIRGSGYIQHYPSNNVKSLIPAVGSRSVAGDFNGDGKADYATLYDMGKGRMKIHVFLSTGTKFSEEVWYEEMTPWYYSVDNVSGRVVAGDFNGDGKDDICAIFDYGGGRAQLHVWESTGTSFKPWRSWREETGYPVDGIVDKVVCGDFNGDGKADVAAIYYYPLENKVRIHVWLSNGSGFSNVMSWKEEFGYNGDLLSGRVVAGDFNGDGKDDIAAIYDYGDNSCRIHVWLSNGTGFPNTASWQNATLTDASKMTGRVVAGDFNGDGKDDIAAMFDYGSGVTKILVWPSTGYSFSNAAVWVEYTGYTASNITGRMVTGDFNGDGVDDICSMYDYDAQRIMFHMAISRKDGFDKSGWNEIANYNARRTTGKHNFTDDYVASFTLKKIPSYAVTYNANGGTNAPVFQIKWQDTALALRSIQPTRTGYTFKGWATSANATTAQYQPGANYTTNANLTLYAVWESSQPGPYTVTYNANGGMSPPAPQAKQHGVPLTLTEDRALWAGRLCIGWATTPDAAEPQFLPGGAYTADANVVLYAVWRDMYYVVYDANGGENPPEMHSKIYGEPLILRTEQPTREGYTFLGWSTNKDATEAQYLPGGSYTNNAAIILFAIWEEGATQPDTYAVAYNANGGTGAPPTQTKTHDIALTLSSTEPTRGAYDFLGWAASANATTAQYQPGGSYTANASVTLYAVWEAPVVSQYTVTYNANGGINPPEEQTKTQDVILTLSSDVPTRDGYTFKGWDNSATATTAQYQPGASYTANASVTLYAVWEADHTHAFRDEWESDDTNHWRECSCGEKDDIAAHTPGEWIVDVAATATEYGSRHKECTVCSYVTEAGIIPATGEEHTHAFGNEWESNAVNHWHECDCGEITDSAPHAPGNWIIDIAATATEDGSKHKECAICGYVTETEAIPATGEGHTHTFGEWMRDSSKHWRECSCGEKTDMAEHTPGDWIIDVAATAATDGSRHKECTVCGHVTVTEAIPATDTTPPTGTILMKTKGFSSFMNTITFGLFFKDTIDVTVTAADGESGVSTVEYLKSETTLSGETDWNSLTWTAIGNGGAFGISANWKGIVYARITDHAGNVSVISSEGVVVFTDSAAATSSISFIKGSDEDETANVTLNGNTVDKIENGTAVLAPGTDYAVSGGAITFKASYLDTLDAGATPYTLTVSYNPLGMSYVEAAENNAPSSTAISLTVLPPGHAHIWGEWESDAASHWHECSCGEKSDTAAHVPGDWIIDIAATATEDGSKHKECTVCGYATDIAAIPATGEGHTHTFGNEWKKDETIHWKECSCGEKGDFAPHTPGDWIVDVAATATTAGSKHKECTVCGFTTATEAIPATGAGHTHSYGTAWKKDATGHWHECSCGEKDGFAAHTPGGWVVDIAATATANGSRHRECTVCGLLTATETIPATGSTPVYKITSGANQSWKKGTVAGATITCDGDFGKFVELKIDGSVVTAVNYTKASGSTIISLNASYLETLAPGAHTVEFVYSDGNVQTGLTILANDNITPVPANNGGSDTSSSFLNLSNSNNGSAGFPKTGEHLSGATIALIIFLLLDLAFVAWKIYEHARRPRRRVFAH